MNKSNLINESNPDPYEGIIRLKELDPYETLFNSDLIKKKKIKSNE